MASVKLEDVKEILDRTLDLKPAERLDFVRQACVGEPDLRREVESLLEHDVGEKPWDEGPLISPVPVLGKPIEPEQRIGPYRITRVLGAGGMGAVALAVREDDFQKQVALKVIRPEKTSPEFVRRFHDERQILAQLEHPNIARILDGGTTAEGQPYFVMEFVEGQPIDKYCQVGNLVVKERLRLFLQVCSALQLAHQNLVVHRDLKPINILVTAEGVPKLLDFGIAKRLATDPGDPSAGPRPRPMTLRYASPEQIAGRSVAISSDIYSLGVLLYQLLTDRYPYSGEGKELAQAIQQARPDVPSAIVHDSRQRRQLVGDLDSIVLKAMHQEPDQRYGSVEQLASDIRRFLEVRPVSARKNTRAYRTSKHVRRHRLPLIAATSVVALSIVFGILATILWRQAVDQKEQAVQAHERSEEVLDFMKGLFRESGPNQSRGEELTALEILRRGEAEIEEGLDEPLLQAELLATIGQIYIQLGDYDSAQAPWERAVYLLRRSYPGGHPALAKAINNLAGWFYDVGEYERAEVSYREALSIKRSGKLGGESSQYNIDTAKSMANLAAILMIRGAYEEAEDLYRQSLDLRRGRYGSEHAVVVRTLRSLGILYYIWGQFERAEPLLRKALAMRERIHDVEDTRVASALASLGRLLHAKQRFEEAEAHLVRCLEIRLQRLGETHLHVALARLDLARLYLDTGEVLKGQKYLNQSLEVLRETKSPEAWEIAEAESLIGGYLAREGRYQEAEEYLVSSYRKLADVRSERAIYTRAAHARLQHLYETWDKSDEVSINSSDPT